MDPSGTPASILLQWETCPFKITHCFFKLRKSIIIFKMSPDMPFCWSLYIRPLCFMSKINKCDFKIIIKRLLNFMGDRKKLTNTWITWFKIRLIIWYRGGFRGGASGEPPPPPPFFFCNHFFFVITWKNYKLCLLKLNWSLIMYLWLKFTQILSKQI